MQFTIMGKELVWFGDFHNEKNPQNEFDKFKKYKNKLSKNDIIKHISNLKYSINLNEVIVYDMFNGNRICVDGSYKDEQFRIAKEFLSYLEHYDIGIPYEYEEYLINEYGLKPKEN